MQTIRKNSISYSVMKIKKGDIMKLVKVTEENLLLAYNLQKEIFPDCPDYLFLKNAVNKNDPYVAHYIAYVDDKPVGITGTYYEDIDKDSIWLSWFGVLPTERKKGYGRQILEATNEICKKMPFKYFRCYTSTTENASAIPLYNSFYQISEKYENKDDETYNGSTAIYSSSLGKDKVTKWNNKYIGIKEYDELCVKGEEYLKNLEDKTIE